MNQGDHLLNLQEASKSQSPSSNPEPEPAKPRNKQEAMLMQKMNEINQSLVDFSKKLKGLTFLNEVKEPTINITQTDPQLRDLEKVEIAAILIDDALHDRSMGHLTDKNARFLIRLKYFPLTRLVLFTAIFITLFLAFFEKPGNNIPPTGVCNAYQK